jgi:hypothetical protein
MPTLEYIWSFIALFIKDHHHIIYLIPPDINYINYGKGIRGLFIVLLVTLFSYSRYWKKSSPSIHPSEEYISIT